jgi:hypothetical protein
VLVACRRRPLAYTRVHADARHSGRSDSPRRVEHGFLHEDVLRPAAWADAEFVDDASSACSPTTRLGGSEDANKIARLQRRQVGDTGQQFRQIPMTDPPGSYTLAAL